MGGGDRRYRSYTDTIGSTLRLQGDLRDNEAEVKHLQGIGAIEATQEEKSDISVDFKRWNMHTLTGKYHTFHIKNDYPIPGAAIADDHYRNHQIEDTTKVLERLRDEDNVNSRKVDSKVQVHEMTEQSMPQPHWMTIVEQTEKVMQDRQKRYENIIGRKTEFIGESKLVAKVFTLIKERELEEVKALLTKGELNVNMCDERMHTTLLMQACSAGALPLVEIFLQFGADPDLVNISGNCALHFAWDSWLRVNAYLPRKKYQYKIVCKIVESLASFGANPRIQQCDGWTPLHFAAMYGHEEAILTLLKAGADVSIRDDDGRTASEVATTMVERGFGDPKKRQAAIGLLNNWPVIQKEQELRNFRYGWQLTLEKNMSETKRANEISQRETQIGSPPKAGSVDLMSREGAGGPAFVAQRDAEERMWGETTNIKEMFKDFELKRRLKKLEHKEVLKVSEYNKTLPVLPNQQQRRTEQETREVVSFDITSVSPGRTGSRRADTSSSNTHDLTVEDEEVQKRRARAQWKEHSTSTAPSTNELVRKQATQAANLLASQNKVISAVNMAENESDEQIMNKVNLLEETRDAMERHHKKQKEQLKNLDQASQEVSIEAVEKDASIPKSYRNAFAGVRGLSNQLKKGAKNIREDTYGSEVSKNIMEMNTGEVYQRRKAQNSILKKPSRYRCDHRTKVGLDHQPVEGSIPGVSANAREKIRAARQDKAEREAAMEVEDASVRAIPPEDNVRKRKQTTQDDAMKSDSLSSMVGAYSLQHKQMMDGEFKRRIMDKALLPYELDKNPSQLKKPSAKKKGNQQSLNSEATGGLNSASKQPPGDDAKPKAKVPHVPKLVPEKLQNDLYGDESMLHQEGSALSTNSLHDRGGLKLGMGQSLMDLANFDTVELTSVNRTAATPSYGKKFIRRNTKTKKNYYNLVYKPPKRPTEIFGKIEEPWEYQVFNPKMSEID